MTLKNEKNENETLKKAQASSTGGEKETESGTLTELELDDMKKHYGVKETLNYALGLDMENVNQTGANSEEAGELNRKQANDLKKDIGYQPQCNCEFGDIDKIDK